MKARARILGWARVGMPIVSSILSAAALAAQPPAASGDAPQDSIVHVTARFAPSEQRRPLAYEGPEGLIIFRATVAGRDAWVLLDTGATRSIVDSTLAGAAGLRIDTASRPLVTPTGTLAAGRVENLSFLVADQMEARLSSANAADLGHLSSIMGRPIGAVLGWDVLSDLVIHVDPGRRTITLARSGEITAPAGAGSVPFSRLSRQVSIRVGPHILSLFVDLGANAVIRLGPEAWAQVAPPGAETRPGRSMHAQGDVHAIQRGRLPEVGLGPVTLRNVPVTIGPLLPAHGDGLLGMGFFRRLVFLIDARQGRLWFLPPGNAAQASEATAK